MFEIPTRLIIWCVVGIAALATVSVKYHSWKDELYDSGYNARVAEEQTARIARKEQLGEQFQGISQNQQEQEDERNRTKPTVTVGSADRLCKQPASRPGQRPAADSGQSESRPAAGAEVPGLGEAFAHDADNYPACYALAHNLYRALVSERDRKATVANASNP